MWYQVVYAEMVSDKIGLLFTTKKSGTAKIINHRKKTRANGKEDSIYQIEFLDTGHQTWTTMTHLRLGTPLDPNTETVLGVGSLGQGDGTEREKVLWGSMMARCYNTNHQHYEAYGGRGVKVCEKWKCRAAFFKDLRNLPGYQSWASSDNGYEYQLDKDLLGQGSDIYSPDTCCFIPKKLNAQISNNCPISIDGQPFFSVRAAAAALGVRHATVSRWYNKQRKDDLIVASLLPNHPFVIDHRSRIISQQFPDLDL